MLASLQGTSNKRTPSAISLTSACLSGLKGHHTDPVKSDWETASSNIPHPSQPATDPNRENSTHLGVEPSRGISQVSAAFRHMQGSWHDSHIHLATCRHRTGSGRCVGVPVLPGTKTVQLSMGRKHRFPCRFTVDHTVSL